MIDNNGAGMSDAKRALLEHRIRGAPAAPPPSRPTPRADASRSPLSAVQEQLWYFSQLVPGNPVYNEAVTIRKRGALDVDALRAAFNEVVRRHDVWHSVFQVVDGEPWQVVCAAPAYELAVVDLSGLSTVEAERRATRLAAADAMRPYDLERGPLLRPLLVRFAADDHRLYLALHHLIFDGGSLSQTILPELIALYDGCAIGGDLPLPSNPVQYADYATWEREWTAGPQYADRIEYWKHHLAGAPALALPLDRARPALPAFRGGAEPIHICAESARRLRELGHSHGTTLFQTLASVFAVLLHRYAGEKDIVFGTVANLRRRVQDEHVVGCCVTPLVLRVDVSDDPLFTALLGRVRDDLVDALDNKVPFERLVRALHPLREAGANPICQAIFVLEPKATATDSLWGLDLTATEVDDAIGHAKFDLSVELDERPDGNLSGRLIFNTDVFNRETVRRMITHWDTLLDGVIDNPTRPISELPLLSEVERRRQLVEWNATDLDFPRDSCVHHLVTAQAARTPDAIAVTDSRGTLTFAELEDNAARLAAHLRVRGVGPDVIVGVCMERSVDMVVALLAVLKAGGAYMPLEPDHPGERLATMIDDARPAAILTTGGLRERLPTGSAGVVEVDTARAAWMRHDPRERGEARASNLAYVLYTSGSTGQPKGVMIEHRSIVNQLVWRANSFGLGAADRVLQKTPLSFDVSLWELFCPLISGASLVLLEPGAQGDPVRIMDAIRTHGVTALHFVPSMLREFLAADVRGCDSVRLVASSGETLSAPLANRFFECFGPEVELRNLYGPTEAAVDVTSWRCEPGHEELVPIGRPVANTQIYLLGAGDGLVPVGVPGELCIGGVQVARGYLNRAELTATNFVANPFQTGERIYRTGDRARYREDGTIEHLGRLDHQLKIRGFRIEPAEIETALLACTGVASAVVVAREDTPGDRRLVAYIVPTGDVPTSARLREQLRRTLPEHMVPAAFVTVEVLPLTPSGKLDRTALPQPQWYRASTTERPPRSPIETQLVAIWKRILHLDRVGVEDDFFDVGGHSLLAVRLLVEVRREFGVEVPLAAFFERRGTVAGLAAAIEAIRQAQLSDQATVEDMAQATTPILFFIHADESSMLTLRHFIGPLGSGHRVVGLLPERDGRRFDRSRSIEELATPMLESIRQAQAHGPYFLAGYSLGGVLVYELAGRLEAAGEQVGWLGVLDSATPAANARYQRQRLSLRQRVGRQRQRGVRGAARKTHEVLRRELTAAAVRLRLRRSEMSDEFDWRGAKALVDRYACHPNNVAMDLFVTADRAAGAGSDSLGWADLHHGILRVHRVEGNHRDIVTEPQVTVVADMVGRSLRDAGHACDGG